jgi:hypothetical protein
MALTDIYERKMQIVPDCLKPNENEIPVRQYTIAVLRNALRFERAEGRMQITNKRVIFRAAGRSIGGKTTVQQEFAIDELAGIEAISNYRFGFIYLLLGFFIVALSAMTAGQIIVASGNANAAMALGLLFGFGGLVPFFMLRVLRWEFLIHLLPLGFSLGAFGTLRIVTGDPIWFVLFVISCIINIWGLGLYCLKPDLKILIKNKGAIEGAAPIKIGRTRGFWAWRQNAGTGFSEVFPTVETDGAIREIGAMIADIQKMGDFGLKKWVVDETTTKVEQ